MRQDNTYELHQPRQVSGQPGQTPDLQVSDARYYPAASHKTARVHVELDVNRDRNPANTERMNAAHERLDGGSHHIDTTIDAAATARLQERTGTTAHITDGGYSIGITMNVPADRGDRPTLTAAQETQIPALVHAIQGCLPMHEQHKSLALADVVAQQIPAKTDVIDSFDQVTLREIIDHHEHRMVAHAKELLRDNPDAATEVADLQPALQAFAAVRLAQQSFPQHPSTALAPGHNPTPAAPSPTPTAHRPTPSIDR